MTPALFLPAGLAALAALALPLILHIARASEQRLTDFAALRWLRERPRPRHRLRFDEWPLLIVRLILLALLALFLARPALLGSASERPRILVIPGVDRAAVTEPDARWLAPGFPKINKMMPPVGDWPSLLREADATLPARVPLMVIVPAILQGADAERPRLSRPVAWHVVPGAMPVGTAVKASPVRLAVRVGTGAAGARYARALAIAWGGKTADVGPTSAPLPAADRALLWVAGGALPASIRAWSASGGTLLLASEAQADVGAQIAARDSTGQPLIVGGGFGKGRLFRFTRPLTPEAVPDLLDPTFPETIRRTLAAPLPPPARVAVADYAPETGGPPPARPIRDLRDGLALLILAFVALERWLATARRRAVAP